MKKHGRSPGVLAGALILALLFVVKPASAGTAGTDASAIAAFLSIGLANAPTHFSAISGDEVGSGSGSFEVTKWPDHTHFVKCVAGHQAAIPAGDMPEYYMYMCDSTLRSDSQAALFKIAARAVRVSLPSGYASSGASPGDLGPQEVWKRSGSPEVELTVPASGGKSYYQLAIDVYP